MKISILLFLSAVCALAQTGPVTISGSPFDEQNPRISPDGKSLFVTIAGHPQNQLGKKDPGDVFELTLTPEGWSEPRRQDQWNNNHWNAVIGFSADGSQVYLAGHYRPDGQPAASQGISVSRRTAFGWSAPENIRIPYLTDRSVGSGMWLDADAGVLVYSASTPLSGGAEDLHVSFYGETGWSEPVPLGPVVNSSFQEITPALDARAGVLYFASNRPGGKGSFDLYRSERLDSTWTAWSEPVQLNEGKFNTAGRDRFPAPDARGFWYVSTSDSDGYGDIRFVPSASDAAQPFIAPGPPQREEKEVAQPVRPGKRLLAGVITADGNQATLPATVLVRGTNAKTVADAKGRFSLEIGPDPVILEFSYPGFIDQVRSVSGGGQTVSLDVRLQAVEVGTVVKLPNVLFEQGSPNLLPASYDELDMVVGFLKTNPSVRILVAGHTDGRGDPKLNQILSEKRVKRVKAYLVSKGVKSSRIEGKGYGGSKPIADGRTESGRKLNRRVEFSIISK